MKNNFWAEQYFTHIQLANATKHDYMFVDNAMQAALFKPSNLFNGKNHTPVYYKKGAWADIANTAYKILITTGKRFQLTIHRS